MLKQSAAAMLLLTLLISCGKENSDSMKKDQQKPESTENKSTGSSGVDNTKQGATTQTIKPEAIAGTWINPNDGVGFTLKEGGKAESVNMTASDYKSWKIDGSNLVITSSGKGGSGADTIEEVFIIKTLTPYKLVLSPSNNPGQGTIYARK